MCNTGKKKKMRQWKRSENTKKILRMYEQGITKQRKGKDSLIKDKCEDK